MPNNTILVDYTELNGVELKSIRVPGESQVWDESLACSELRANNKILSTENILQHEIFWLKKFSDRKLNVADAYIGKSITLDDYIEELKRINFVLTLANFN